MTASRWLRRRTPLVVLGVGKFEEVGLKVTQFLLAPLLCVLLISCSSGDREPSQSVRQTNSFASFGSGKRWRLEDLTR